MSLLPVTDNQRNEAERTGEGTMTPRHTTHYKRQYKAKQIGCSVVKRVGLDRIVNDKQIQGA